MAYSNTLPPIANGRDSSFGSSLNDIKEITVDGKKYLEGFTFALKLKSGVGIGIMPRNWNQDSTKTQIFDTNSNRYAFIFKYLSGFSDLAICELYEDCVLKHEVEFSRELLHNLLSSDLSDNVEVVKLGYNVIPDGNYQVCTCDIRRIMAGGCTCGGFKREQEFKKKVEEFNKLLK